MWKELRASILMLLVLTLITGAVYPLVVTVVAQVAFPGKANGSLVMRDKEVIGSELIGQPFDEPKYFWGRPSATSPIPGTAFNAEAGSGSTGSNYGPTNPAQLQAVEDRLKAIREAQVDQTGPVPVELVTASASGLDPHISPAAAEYQVSRVAKARGISDESIRNLVSVNTEDRTLSVLGEPRVNVLKLNLALDAQQQN